MDWGASAEHLLSMCEDLNSLLDFRTSKTSKRATSTMSGRWWWWGMAERWSLRLDQHLSTVLIYWYCSSFPQSSLKDPLQLFSEHDLAQDNTVLSVASGSTPNHVSRHLHFSSSFAQTTAVQSRRPVTSEGHITSIQTMASSGEGGRKRRCTNSSKTCCEEHESRGRGQGMQGEVATVMMIS